MGQGAACCQRARSAASGASSWLLPRCFFGTGGGGWGGLREEGEEQSGGSSPSRTTRFFCCGGCLGKRERSELSLWVMCGVTAALTVAQLVCGAAANSLSLVGDGALMAVDVVCYGVAIYVERQKAHAHRAKRADLFGAVFNTAMLMATTCWVLVECLDRLFLHVANEKEAKPRREFPGRTQAATPGVDVDGSIMIGFTAVNLLADLVIVLVCYKMGALDVLDGCEQTSADSVAGSKSEGPSKSRADSGFDGLHRQDGCAGGDGEVGNGSDPAPAPEDNLNIFGAFAHLAADGVRGVAVLVCGILAVADVVSAEKADAYCSLFVCFFVLAGVVSFMRVVLRSHFEFRTRPPTSTEDAEVAVRLQRSMSSQAEVAPCSPQTIGSLTPFED